jgi:hypothetical protein
MPLRSIAVAFLAGLLHPDHRVAQASRLDRKMLFSTMAAAAILRLRTPRRATAFFRLRPHVGMRTIPVDFPVTLA